jgi:hypothetical protein
MNPTLDLTSQLHEYTPRQVAIPWVSHENSYSLRFIVRKFSTKISSRGTYYRSNGVVFVFEQLTGVKRLTSQTSPEPARSFPGFKDQALMQTMLAL